MKIYQTLKPRGLVLLMIIIILSAFFMGAIAGDLSQLTPQLIIFLTELGAMFYGLFFGKNHLAYCPPESHGYKYFRSIPNFERHFKKQCIVSDIICYGIGYAVTVINFIFMSDKTLSALIGIIYLFIVALSCFITAFVNTSHRLYIYTMMFSIVPLTAVSLVIFISENITKNLIPLNARIIILICVTVFAVVSEILFYKRLSNNIKTSYGKG